MGLEPGFSEVQDRIRELRPWFGVDCHATISTDPRLDVHRKVTNTKAARKARVPPASLYRFRSLSTSFTSGACRMRVRTDQGYLAILEGRHGRPSRRARQTSRACTNLISPYEVQAHLRGLQHSQPVLACIGNPTRSSALALSIEPHRWSHGRSAPRHGVVFWQIAQIDVGMHVRGVGNLNTASIDRSISDFRQPRCMCRCASVMRHPEQRNLPEYSPRRNPTTARRTKFSVE